MMSRNPSKSEEPPWQSFAKCKGMPASWFVPDGPGGNLDRVVAICIGRDGHDPCPVQAECAAFGAENDEIGVWGGEVRSTKRKVTKPKVLGVTLAFEQDARPVKVRK